MSTPRRLLALRLIALLALVASGALTSDALRPDEHGFCPLEQACARARSSPLGSVFGIPTSGFGMAAFGGLLLLTLLPPAAARAALRPAGLLAALSGLALVAYQAIVLKSFCPLCLVADASGLAAGVAVLGWEPVPMRRGGKAPDGEHVGVRFRWALAGGLAIAGPLLWPHPAPRPSWVPLPAAANEDVAEATAPSQAPSATLATPPPEPRLSPAATPDLSPRWEPLRDPPRVGTPLRGGAALSSSSEGADPAESSRPAPPPPALPPAPVPVPLQKASPPEIRLVEYLNPFCAHCRATHARLERILGSGSFPVRRRKLYVWTSGKAPLWARACACAAAAGREDAMFAELLRADDSHDESVWAAARRAGLNPAALSACIDAGDTARLESDHQRVLASRLEGLPTLDIGRRRLEGEQSEEELTEALLAAQADLGGRGSR